MITGEHTHTTPSGHGNRKSHIPHPRQLICQGMNSQNSPVPADWAPKEPSSTLACILHYKQSQMCQAHGNHKHCGPCCSAFGPVWIHTAERERLPSLMYGLAAAGRCSWPLPCILSPQFFWHSWDWGYLGFQQTHEPHRKVGENSGSFWKTLDPQRGAHSSPIITDLLYQKCNAAQHWLTGGKQPARRGVPLERLWWKVPAATEQYLQHGLTDAHKIPEDGYRGTAFCHPLPFVSARGPPPLPWNAPNVSLRPCAAHRLEKPPATSGWWGEAQTNPAIAVTMAKCPACSWQGSCYTPASPGAGR